MAQLVRVKLLEGIVENGAVWPEGSELLVSEEHAQELISANKAEAVKISAYKKTEKDAE